MKLTYFILIKRKFLKRIKKIVSKRFYNLISKKNQKKEYFDLKSLKAIYV